ncbi:MAG: sugar transferase, partial [bacterium]|nr:sugar transferase [bacterium]
MKKFVLVLIDIAILYTALWLTLYIRYQDNWSIALSSHLLPFTILFAVWLTIFYIANFYEINGLKNGPNFYANFSRVLTINAIIGMIFFYLIPFFGIAPRRNFFIFLAFFTGFDFLARHTFNNIIAGEKFSRPTLIVGLNEQSEKLAALLENSPQLGYQLKSILEVTNLSSLEKLVDEKKIDTIIISNEIYQTPRLIEYLYKLLHKKINFYHLSNFYEQISQKIILSNIDQAWFLENLSEGGKNFYEISKRVLDVAFALIFMLPTMVISPLIALAIRISSPGPVFYKQKRVGRYGKEFMVIKFRTMQHNAEQESGPTWERDHHLQVTRVGKMLRATHLDELPQLWNILKGEMSFVGPRAERPEFHEQLKNQIPFYEE